MTFLQWIIAFLILYICVYALISRVCQCIEHCATARAYSKFRENGIRMEISDLETLTNKSSKEKRNVKETNQIFNKEKEDVKETIS